MTTISILISTYGERSWEELAMSRAYPSCVNQEADEILVLHVDDMSIAEVRNANAQDAVGDWLLHVDADDELAPGFVGAMRQALEQQTNPHSLLFTPAVSYVRKGRVAPPVFLDRGISLREDNWLVVGTLIHRDLFQQVSGFSDQPHGFEDFALWSKCWRAGATVVKVQEAVYIAHWNPRSKHHLGWRDRKWQVETHQRVIRELDVWERDFKAGAPA